MPAPLRLRRRMLWWFPRRTVRLRLTAFYSGLFLVSGATLLAITYLLVRFTFPVAAHAHSAGTAGAGGRKPGPPLAPLPSLASLQAQDARQRAADLHQLVVVSGIALVVMALASLVSGWLVAGRVLRPLRTITAAARDLSSTDLHRRLGLTGPDDALLTLATSDRGIDRWEPVDLSVLTEGAIAVRQAEARRLGLRVRASLAPARTAGDRDLAGRLVANLLDNACGTTCPVA